MPTETTPLRGEQYASDAQKRKRIVGITGAVVVLAAIVVVLWLTLSGHSSKSTEVTEQTTPEPTPALRTEAPVITELPTIHVRDVWIPSIQRHDEVLLRHRGRVCGLDTLSSAASKFMATETTPLRNVERRPQEPRALHKKRIAGLAVFGLIMVVVAVLTTTNVGRKAHTQAIPQRPIEVVQPLNATRRHHTPAPTPKNWYQCGTEKSEAGYITLPYNVDSHLFYWYFESRKTPDTDPLVLWMTGSGSDCSSLAALLMENGPCRINPDATTALNPHSWTSEANVIWLDQPTNVGFSYGNNTKVEFNAEDVKKNVYWFLQGFLDKHPEFEGRALFLAGEGYAAHYVPAAAHYIWKENLIVVKANATLRINLQGITIGNGLVNPVVQTPHALDMAVSNSYNISLINPTDLGAAKEVVPVCSQLLNYDIRKKCDSSDPSECYNTSAVAEYLNSNAVRAYLNVSEQVTSWQQCSSSNGEHFSSDLMKNFDGYVADLLNDGSVRVLIYSGDADLVCNWRGSEAWTKQLKWKHQQDFNDVKEHDFQVAGEIDTIDAGSVRSHNNQFTFIRVFKAGHMVPKDQPAIALEMINRFIKNQSLFNWPTARPSLLVVTGVSLLLALAFVVHQDSSLSSLKNLKGATNNNFERPQDEFFCGITNHETGYIKLPNKDDDNYFYWFVESRSDPQRDPLVLWLTGGPGCSSMMALLAENGPCHVQSDLSTKTNPYSWNGHANVIWLDQPTGVGYSYGPTVDYDSGELNVAENIYWFLQEFLKKHPDLADREFFVTGESYGGHYVPAAASHILKANMLRHLSPNAVHVNLAGIAVGNGLTDPAVQYQHSVDMAFNSYNVSLLDDQAIEDMRKAQPVCHELIMQCQKDRPKCVDAMEFCFGALEGPYYQSGRNPYDIREPCTEENVMKCFHFEHIDEYLNTPTVLTKLGVDVHKSKSWRECDTTVGAGFAFDEMLSSAEDVKLLLDAGVRVLIYAGDADLMCNWVGNQAWVMALDWSGKTEFNNAPSRPFVTSEATDSGRVRSFENLAFIRVFNSGHMVPMDQPVVSFEMINKFFQNKDF
ncbi:hypothetical protein JG688_00002728 [Phytophthora aleatoria]|uniref:Carboxypeptidase n=1 Tax=Phytophthora aleatoria TaxID=2496075 RepID=A0A8J5JBZ6_9STRA|nr:hypothetical protein JG688_00002728 [Phytophthora aleatoria]